MGERKREGGKTRKSREKEGEKRGGREEREGKGGTKEV